MEENISTSSDHDQQGEYAEQNQDQALTAACTPRALAAARLQ